MAGEEAPLALLGQALEGGRVDVLRSLISELGSEGEVGALLDDLGATPVGTLLHRAVELDAADAVRALLSSGANPALSNAGGQTPLALAASEAVRGAFVQELLQAVGAAKLGRVCQLLAAGVSAQALDSPQSRNTPLHWAASFGDQAVLR